ncbi:MAG: hypothetical protein LBH54_04925 [Clostridiales bacterium]|jgi:V/A-type H+-transporting ATPase subunit E|nr:hypothetical protein [Clostridiales bacterium]
MRVTGLEGITRKILEDASAKADGIRADAQSAAERLAAGEQERAETAQARRRDEAEREAAARARRILAAARLEGKKELLRVKQELLDEAFAKAGAALAGLDDAAYNALIQRMSDGVSGEITLLPRDREKGAGGGFIAKDGKTEFNFSFDALVKNARERPTAALTELLFGE